MSISSRSAAAEGSALASSPIEGRRTEDASGGNAPAMVLRDLALRTAAFAVLGLASTTLLALPYIAAGPHAPEDSSAYSVRIDQAFQLADEMTAGNGPVEAISAAARKSDSLALGLDCAAQTWPHIGPQCVLGAETGLPASSVRTVTVEYELTKSSSALVRLPVQQVASQ